MFLPNLSPTLYPELNTVLQDLIDSVQVILNNTFVGAYLIGSFAVGDFDLDSDVDFIVVTEAELADYEVQALQEMHERIFRGDSTWAQHLEGSYFPKDILRDDIHSNRELWFLDNGDSSLTLSPHCNTILVRWVLREHGIVLIGTISGHITRSITGYYPVEIYIGQNPDMRSGYPDKSGSIQ